MRYEPKSSGPRHSSDICSRQHLIVDTYLIDVSASDILKSGIYFLRANDLSMGSELVKARIEDGGNVNLSNELTIHKKPHSLCLVPFQTKMDPLVRFG